MRAPLPQSFAPADVRPETSRGASVLAYWHGAENALSALVLGAMVLLPVMEILLRQVPRGGLAGAIPLVQHLVLVLSMLGASLAARDNRLLSFSTLPVLLNGAAKAAARIFAHAFAASLTLVLLWAGVEYLNLEESGPVAFGIPGRAFELMMPLGFGAIAARLIWNASGTWRGRGFAGLLVMLFLGAAWLLPVPSGRLLGPALLLLVMAIVMGAPVYSALGGVAIILFWTEGESLASLPLMHFSLTTQPMLAAIPLFTLAGYFLSAGGASRRLIDVFHSLAGGWRGGPGIAAVLACTFFAAFTGGSGVTILALGGLLMPILLASGYSEKNGMGLVTTSSSLGLLFPPCVPLILYVVIANTVMTQLGHVENAPRSILLPEMFLAGLIPGLLLVLLVSGWAVLKAKGAAPIRRDLFSLPLAGRAVWRAKWELLLPFVAVAALFSGYATPVEAAALTALYAFVIETCVYRDLNLFRDVPRVMAECALLVGGVLLILGMAMGLNWYFILNEIPLRASEWVAMHIDSRLVFLLLLFLGLIIAGCFMDIFSATVVIVPLIIPMAIQFDIHPIHLGIIFLATLELGYLTPPVGLNLFLAASRFARPVMEVYRSVAVLLAVLAVGVLLIICIPALSTTLPGLLYPERPPAQGTFLFPSAAISWGQLGIDDWIDRQLIGLNRVQKLLL
jgi:C4-dicarboxylate transporter, DctM subunit